MQPCQCAAVKRDPDAQGRCMARSCQPNAPAAVSASTRRLTLSGKSAAMVSAMKPPRLQPLHTMHQVSAPGWLCWLVAGVWQPSDTQHSHNTHTGTHSHTHPHTFRCSCSDQQAAHRMSGKRVPPCLPTSSSSRKSAVDSARTHSPEHLMSTVPAGLETDSFRHLPAPECWCSSLYRSLC